MANNQPLALAQAEEEPTGRYKTKKQRQERAQQGGAGKKCCKRRGRLGGKAGGR